MGLALEWLNPAGCKSIAMEILTNPKPHQGEIWADCPFHDEKTPGGAFSYNFEKDKAKCQSCGKGGDLISIYCAVFSLPDKEGFIEFKNKYCPGVPYRNPQRAERKAHRAKEKNYFEQDHDRSPAPEKWIERACSFVDHSVDRLMSSDAALTELENRWGIGPHTAMKFNFGMNDKDKYPPYSSWGLPYEEKNGKEKKIWLPKGLVIPCMVNGEVRKIKIRRPDPQTPWGEKRQYWEVVGGENWRFHHYMKSGAKPSIVVVIEAERDAALVYQECAGIGDGSLVAIAGGGAAKRPHDEEILALIRGADVLLSALDTDGPGAQNTNDFWIKEFGYAKYWPVPKRYGKDVGEAFKKGLNIVAWVRAGLPEWKKNKIKGRS